MNKKIKLQRIIKDLRSAEFDFSVHAYERMAQRGIFATDILALISNGLGQPHWNEVHGSWNFTGYGLGAELITIACVYNSVGTLIVTVYWE